MRPIILFSGLALLLWQLVACSPKGSFEINPNLIKGSQVGLDPSGNQSASDAAALDSSDPADGQDMVPTANCTVPNLNCSLFDWKKHSDLAGDRKRPLQDLILNFGSGRDVESSKKALQDLARNNSTAQRLSDDLLDFAYTTYQSGDLNYLVRIADRDQAPWTDLLERSGHLCSWHEGQTVRQDPPVEVAQSTRAEVVSDRWFNESGKSPSLNMEFSNGLVASCYFSSAEAMETTSLKTILQSLGRFQNKLELLSEEDKL